VTPLQVHDIYTGSDGEATKRLYASLDAIGPIGRVALNLFRAQKCSARAKVYRGGLRGRGSYKSMAYDRKQWSMDQLCQVLEEHGVALGVTWGWKRDPAAEFHAWVLYVQLPVGQVSFHTAGRGQGPDFSGEWDGVRDVAAWRVIRFVSDVLTPSAKSTEVSA
jgi:hypothetical protein